MDISDRADRREQQRIRHLVLERPRPKSERPKPDRAKSAGGRGKRRTVKIAPVVLEPGIEEVVAQRERWSHKAHGTPQTHDHAARYRAGAIERLFHTAAIDAVQLQAAVSIAAVVEQIRSDVNLRTASLETRIQTSRHGDAFYERLGQVRAEMAYTRWRAAQGGAISMLLAIIVEDLPLTEAARRYRMGNRRARAVLIEALDAWSAIHGATCKEIDRATIEAARAGLS